MMDHRDVREQLELAAVEPGGLDRVMAGDTIDAAALVSHLAGCEDCLAEFGRLRKAVRGLPPDPSNAELHDVRIRGKRARYAAELARNRPVVAWRRAIVAGARARVQGRRIPGSHWAISGGCGVSIEDWSGDDRVMIGCGMGHVPPRSQRFLHFFVPRNF